MFEKRIQKGCLVSAQAAEPYIYVTNLEHYEIFVWKHVA